VSIVICAKRIGKYLERKCYKRFEEWRIGICSSRRILDRFEKEFEERDNETMKMAELKKVK